MEHLLLIYWWLMYKLIFLILLIFSCTHKKIDLNIINKTENNLYLHIEKEKQMMLRKNEKIIKEYKCKYFIFDIANYEYINIKGYGDYKKEFNTNIYISYESNIFYNIKRDIYIYNNITNENELKPPTPF